MTKFATPGEVRDYAPPGANGVRYRLTVPDLAGELRWDARADELGGRFTDLPELVRLIRYGLAEMDLDPADRQARLDRIEAWLAAGREELAAWDAAGDDVNAMREVLADPGGQRQRATAGFLRVQSEVETAYPPLAQALRINRARPAWRGLAAWELFGAGAEIDGAPLPRPLAQHLEGIAGFVDRLCAPTAAEAGNSASSSGAPSDPTTP